MKNSHTTWHDVASIIISEQEPLESSQKRWPLVRVTLVGIDGVTHDMTCFGFAEDVIKIEHHPRVDQPIEAR